jgi:nitrite reductase (NADH) large subunit
VLGYRDIADTEAMIEAAGKYRHAVVIGAGLLGLEAANGLMLRGMDVTVVHLGEWIMERQLDKAAADMLQASLEAKGMKFLLARQTEALLPARNAQATWPSASARCASRTAWRFPPTWSWWPPASAPTTRSPNPPAVLRPRPGARHPCLRHLQTVTDPRIYAVGECVSHRGIAYGLVAPLFEQGKVCANHLANFGIGRYEGSVTSTKLKVTGIDVFSAGDFMGGPGTEEIVLHDRQGGVYKRSCSRTTASSARCCTATPPTARGTSS